jgi:hypothetical protein
LAVEPAARIVVNIEFELIGGNSEARLVRYPGNDFFEDASQELFVYLILIMKREVQVLREAIRLEVTLLKTCAALEDPAFRKLLPGSLAMA